MDLLIKGLEMQKGYKYELVIEDGEVRVFGTEEVIAEAIQLPPHGDLCDKKLIYDKMVENIKIANKEDFSSKKAKEAVIMAYKAVLYELESEIPTIIESTEGE